MRAKFPPFCRKHFGGFVKRAFCVSIRSFSGKTAMCDIYLFSSNHIRNLGNSFSVFCRAFFGGLSGLLSTSHYKQFGEKSLSWKKCLPKSFHTWLEISRNFVEIFPARFSILQPTCLLEQLDEKRNFFSSILNIEKLSSFCQKFSGKVVKTVIIMSVGILRGNLLSERIFYYLSFSDINLGPLIKNFWTGLYRMHSTCP